MSNEEKVKGTVITREEAELRGSSYYICCVHPETGEKLAIRTSRKLKQVVKDLLDTGVKYGEKFVEQHIRIEGYVQYVDEKSKEIVFEPATVCEGKVHEVIMKLGSKLQSKEDTIRHLRRAIISFLDASDMTMCSIVTVFDTDREGVVASAELLLDSNVGVVKDTHYVVLDNTLSAQKDSVRETGKELLGVNFPSDQDNVKSIVLPGSAEFSVGIK